MGRGDDGVCFLEADGGDGRARQRGADRRRRHECTAPSAEPSATPVANDVPTPFPTLAPGTDLRCHTATRGVIQTTGGEAATVALTFDDGPSPTYTPQVLRILDKHDIKATFCVVGKRDGSPRPGARDR